MSMEALIDSSALLQNLESKKDELPGRLGKLVQDVSNIYRNAVVLEAPRITGNLKSSIRVEDIDDFSRRVYPDEGQARYGYFVLIGVRGKGRVEPRACAGHRHAGLLYGLLPATDGSALHGLRLRPAENGVARRDGR